MPHRRDPRVRIISKCRLKPLDEGSMLFLNPLDIASCIDTEHVFRRVPQKVGFDPGGLLDALRHQATSADLLLALILSRVFDLHQSTIRSKFQNKRNFLVLKPARRKSLVRITIRALSFIVISERMQNHPLTSTLSQAGTLSAPASRRARKKRGFGSAILV